jgi:hypothetical protein
VSQGRTGRKPGGLQQKKHMGAHQSCVTPINHISIDTPYFAVKLFKKTAQQF